MEDFQHPTYRPSSVSDIASHPSTILSEAAQRDDDKPVRCAKFRQQELWAWKPVWSPNVVSIMYLIVAIIFIPLGIVILVQSRRMFITPRYRYDSEKGCALPPGISSTNITRECSIPFKVPRDVKQPLYLYYGIVNFYQNARTYVTSRSDPQLRGEKVNTGSVGTCDPLIKNSSEPNGVLYPCGLAAQSFFNDTLTLCEDPNCAQVVPVTRKGIAWDIDVKKRFKPFKDARPDQRDLITNEEFMNWMRLSAYRNWKKLHRIITTDLRESTYYLKVNSNFPVEQFGGEKFFFISETTWFGGPNQILGLSFIVVGGISLLFAIMFLIQARMLIEAELPEQTNIDLGEIVKRKEHITDGQP